jgi:hypothetical protein
MNRFRIPGTFTNLKRVHLPGNTLHPLLHHPLHQVWVHEAADHHDPTSIFLRDAGTLSPGDFVEILCIFRLL